MFTWQELDELGDLEGLQLIFLKILMRYQQEIDWMIDRLIEELKEELPDLGRNLVVDSKALRSHACRPGKKSSDGRRDTDADFGAKRI